jgi:hypothetical protein
MACATPSSERSRSTCTDWRVSPRISICSSSRTGATSLDEISADDLLGEYPAIQYVPPDGSFRLDLLTRLGEAFAFRDLEIERVSFDDLTVSVASPRTLYRMKRDTVRLKDKADAEMLRRQFDLGEQD